MFRLTHCVLVLSVDVSLSATGGKEEDVVAFVGGDSAGEDCIGGDEVGDPLDVIQGHASLHRVPCTTGWCW